MKASLVKTKPQPLDHSKVISLLDVAGSCIVDIAFNHLYDRAITIHEKTSAGLSDCYRQVLSDYINESNTPRFFSMLLNSIHHYTRMSTIYNAISYPDCITLYASLFVPQMYISSLTAAQKLNLLSMSFGNAVREFADAIIQQYIGCIIDDHCDPVNIELLQDCILEILMHQRDTSYERFIESQKPVKRVVINTMPKQVPKATSKGIIRLTTIFKKSIAERDALKKRNKALIKKHTALVTQFEQMKTMFLKQLTDYKDQAKLVEDLKAQLSNLSYDKDITESKCVSVENIEYSEHKSGSDSDNDNLFTLNEYV